VSELHMERDEPLAKVVSFVDANYRIVEETTIESARQIMSVIPGWASDQRRSANSNWVAVPLRLVVGYGFIAHGYAKLTRGPEHFAAVLSALHVPEAVTMSWLTIGVEIIGGIAVLAGAFVTLMSIPLAVVLIAAAVTVHLPFGFSSIKLLAVTAEGPRFGQPGYELDLLYLACLAALVLGGAGPLAIDTFRSNRRRKQKAVQ
jgi:putative oxidoreductase